MRQHFANGIHETQRLRHNGIHEHSCGSSSERRTAAHPAKNVQQRFWHILLQPWRQTSFELALDRPVGLAPARVTATAPCHPDPREFPPNFEAPVGQSRKAVNGRLRLAVYGRTRTVPVPYKMVSQRLTVRVRNRIYGRVSVILRHGCKPYRPVLRYVRAMTRWISTLGVGRRCGQHDALDVPDEQLAVPVESEREGNMSKDGQRPLVARRHCASAAKREAEATTYAGSRRHGPGAQLRRRANARKEPGTVRRTANNGTLMVTEKLAWAASGGLDASALKSPLLVVTMSWGDGAEHETHGFA
ncbi:hypothetical protein B0H13DRAFT_1852497 [Mycena leptocephala]|nr:hypothetical protein B0H13DRAFT_1915632 [Mycena leptocephala]KAJ7937525.1 hypothetical protein B0H13DRAFT_1852497 [Mycena leptocephala]